MVCVALMFVMDWRYAVGTVGCQILLGSYIYLRCALFKSNFCLPPEGHEQLLLLLLLLLLTFSFFKASAYANLNFGIPYTFLVLLDTFENIL